jgi:hypothetical protein
LARQNPAVAWNIVKDDPAFKIKGGVAKWQAAIQKTIFKTWAARDQPAALTALAALEDSRAGSTSILAAWGFFDGALPDKKQFPEQWAATRDGLAAEILKLPGDLAVKNILMALIAEYRESLTGLDPEPAEAAAARQEVADWICGLPMGDQQRTRFLLRLAQMDGCGFDRAPEVWPWFWAKVPENLRAETLKDIIRYWAADEPFSARDPNACGKWLNTLGPLDAAYAPALKSFAEIAAATDPEAGLAWAERISDPIVRSQALLDVGDVIREHWPDKAEALLGKR